MKQKNHQAAFPATLIAVLAAVFLSTICFATANLSFAEPAKKKSPAVAATSAVEHAEVQIKQLQDTLQITKDQEKLWNDVTGVMRENAKEMDALTRDRAEKAKTMNAVEHMKFHSQITAAHLDQLNKFIPPFEAFYASLSDEQKKTTDTIFRTGEYGKHKSK